jgi:hypothetical protein
MLVSWTAWSAPGSTTGCIRATPWSKWPLLLQQNVVEPPAHWAVLTGCLGLTEQLNSLLIGTRGRGAFA